MGPKPLHSLRTQLLACFAGVGLLLALLSVLGNEVMRRAQDHLREGLSAHVQPLERMARLQARMAHIRVLEIELPRLADVFAVSAQLDTLRSEQDALDRELATHLAALPMPLQAGSVGLTQQWQRYRDDLRKVALHAAAMKMDEAAAVSAFDSLARYKAIADQLGAMAGHTERQAATMVGHAVAEQDALRRRFAWSAAAGLALLGLALAAFARSVNRRVSSLRDAAVRLAHGEGGAPIALAGSDELTELGSAFNTMRDQVGARERALLEAHEALESRVAERTRELHESHARLEQEVRERRRAQAELNHQAQYDGLTELPNRTLAMSRLAQGLQQAAQTRSILVVMFVDLDDFKKVNDTLGHAAGDELLVQAAARLMDSARPTDTVARLGGDEFLLLLGDLQAADHAARVAQKIVQAFAAPFRLGEHEVVVTPSIGMAVYPDDGAEPQTLLRHADLAMYEAKERGRNHYRFYDKTLNERSSQRLAMERQLRDALRHGEFSLHFQPVLDAADSRLVAAEALIRWHSAEGPVPPASFIPVAEHAGLIVEIGDWVIDAACAQLAAWRALLAPGFRLAVNVSAGQFRGDRLLRTLRAALARHGVPASALQFEVTETLLMRSESEAMETLLELRRMGVELALDDFGTGYSSLSYLKRFPFNALKVDRQFVRDLAVDADDRALVAATIALGRSLNLSVVAEGVETDEQFAFLRAEHCHRVQGYLFDKPLPAARFEARWLRPRPAVAAAAPFEEAL